MRIFAITAMAVMLAACASHTMTGEKLTVSQDVMKGFEHYKGWVTSTGHAAFAVSKDGRAYGDWGCPSSSCRTGPSFESQALKDCERYSGGVPCVIFAENRDIIVPYQVTP